MSQMKKGIIGLLVLFFIFILMFFVFGIYTIKTLTQGNDDMGIPSEETIAVVEIKGVIMDSRKIVEELLEVEKKDNIKAIILRIDSPGGAVGPTQEVYEEVVRIDQKKPVYASFGTIAASGGYYIGAASRRIYSNAGTLTGSIGVIMQFVDLAKLYEFAKISPETIQSGKYKDMGNPSRALTEEERGLLKGMVKGVHQQFINDILQVRRGRIKGDIHEYAQGQVFTGEEAYQRGLVDKLAGLWSAGREIHRELGLKGEFQLSFVHNKKPFSFFDLFEKVDNMAQIVLGNVPRNQLPMLLFTSVQANP